MDAVPGLRPMIASRDELARRITELEALVQERTRQLERATMQLAEFSATLDRAQVIVQKLDGTILLWNSGAEALYGFSCVEALGRKSHELLRSELPESLEQIHLALQRNNCWSGEFRQRCRDGTEIWVTSYWALHRAADGTPVSVVKVNNDITALKHTEAKLRASEATARALFENAGQGILTVSRNGVVVDANGMVLRLFGYTAGELIGTSVDGLLPEKLREKHVGHREAFGRHPYARTMGEGMELVARRKDGSEFRVEISLSYVPETQGGLAMAFISDVTSRKKAEWEREALIGQLENSLAEKTVLVKEVHHRVKNNLAVIAGLIGMQSGTLDDPKAQIAFEECQRRVVSMAMIHEFLYATEHLDRVNFGQYARQLAGELSSSYAIEPGVVEVAVEAEEIELSVHRAVPCGLILNELLSNAMKYAFPNGRKGRIEIRFGRCAKSSGPDESGGDVVLTCSDNGVGIPEGFDWMNASSLGLQIIRILAKQIDGKLTLDRTAGTRFELRMGLVGLGA